MDLTKSMQISASGMRAQGVRMRVIAENLANATSLPLTPDQDPYRRKLVSFRNELDREAGVHKIKVGKVQPDRSDFPTRFDPNHPGADANGYVRIPNVNSLIEMMDMREAQRSYTANINVIEAAKRMMMRTIELLK